MSTETPWWWPVVIDAEHLTALRREYPESAYMDDEELLAGFEAGRGVGQFSATWDHLGDAYAEYEHLARAFLKLVEESGKAPSDFNDHANDTTEENTMTEPRTDQDLPCNASCPKCGSLNVELTYHDLGSIVTTQSSDLKYSALIAEPESEPEPEPVPKREYGDLSFETYANDVLVRAVNRNRKKRAMCEHLLMQCPECGYGWDELPVDAVFGASMIQAIRDAHVTPGPPVQPKHKPEDETPKEELEQVTGIGSCDHTHEPNLVDPSVSTFYKKYLSVSEPDPEPDTNPEEPPVPGPYDCARHKKHHTVSAQDTINAQKDSKKEIVEEILNRRHDGLRSCEDIARDFFNYFREEADEDEVSGLEVALKDRSRHVREACANALLTALDKKEMTSMTGPVAEAICLNVKVS